jgi:hypothetical protein
MVILGVNSFLSAVSMPFWPLLPLLFDASFDSLVYPISLLSRIPRRDPRINSQYARLVVRAQVVLVSVWGIECHRFRPSGTG